MAINVVGNAPNASDTPNTPNTASDTLHTLVGLNDINGEFTVDKTLHFLKENGAKINIPQEWQTLAEANASLVHLIEGMISVYQETRNNISRGTNEKLNQLAQDVWSTLQHKENERLGVEKAMISLLAFLNSQNNQSTIYNVDTKGVNTPQQTQNTTWDILPSSSPQTPESQSQVETTSKNENLETKKLQEEILKFFNDKQDTQVTYTTRKGEKKTISFQSALKNLQDGKDGPITRAFAEKMNALKNSPQTPESQSNKTTESQSDKAPESQPKAETPESQSDKVAAGK